jgi:hypothetical protein
MKNIILGLVATLSLSAFAHEIEGTQMLKGSRSTKLVVNSVKTTCKVKIDKVKNLLLEDSFGNPAYNVKISIDLDGSDLERNLRVKYSKTSWFNNLFTEGSGTIVKDFDYVSPEGSEVKIDDQGRLKVAKFKYSNQNITCSF